MRRLLLLLLGSIFFNSYAQTITPVPPTSNHQGYLEYLPPNYSSTTEKYPCIIFLHGSGEVGNGLEPDIWKVALLGPLREVKVNKHTMCFTVNGKQECFIVIAPQAPYVGAFSGTDFQNLYDHILNSYRIDSERIYVTGLSYGGQTSFTWAASDQNSPNKIAALGIMSGMTDCTTAQNVGSRNIPIWWHHGDADNTPWTSYAKALTIIDCINSVDPNPLPIFTVYEGVGHSAWNQGYRTDHTYNSPNTYEWFLSHRLNKKENIPPSVNAGLDKTIQLPTNTVTLSGTASDPDGNIVIYHWVQQSGPPATLQNKYTPNLTVTNLIQGTYEFALWVKDNDDAAAWDDVTMIVTSNTSGTNNLIGHWTLNKNATDYSGNNYHGTIINGAGYSTDCNEGSYSLKLNGINQYIDLKNPGKLPSGTSPRSLSLWAKTNNISNGYRFAVSLGIPSNSNAMFIGQYGPDLNGGGFANDLVVKNFWNVGIWHHIVLTYDGTTAKMYADGIEVASQSKNWNLIAEKAFIGMQVNGKEFWNGEIDDVRIYNKTLTFSEIQEIYTYNKSSNLIGRWTFNNNTNDFSGNNYHGSFINGASYSTSCSEGSHALKLNGINQYIDLKNPGKLPSGTSPRSLSLWAKTNNISYGYRFAASFGKPSNSNAMFIGQYGPDLNGGGYANDVVVKNFWKVGIWRHIVLTYDGTTAKMYADGIEVASQSKKWNLIAEKAFIGMQVNGKEFWNGEIDDVRIYNKVLNIGEIQELAISQSNPQARKSETIENSLTNNILESPKIYPNPVSDNLFIEIPSDLSINNEALNFKLIDLMGNIVKDYTIDHSGLMSIDVTELKNATYLYFISSNDQVLFRNKLVKLSD